MAGTTYQGVQIKGVISGEDAVLNTDPDFPSRGWMVNWVNMRLSVEPQMFRSAMTLAFGISFQQTVVETNGEGFQAIIQYTIYKTNA